MPSSGARSNTIPSRTTRGAGNGRIGTHYLTCGHPSPTVPAYRPTGEMRRTKYWCATCSAFKGRR